MDGGTGGQGGAVDDSDLARQHSAGDPLYSGQTESHPVAFFISISTSPTAPPSAIKGSVTPTITFTLRRTPAQLRSLTFKLKMIINDKFDNKFVKQSQR